MSNPIQRQVEDEVLVKAEQLDPTDQSRSARHLREVAASIREHRMSEQIRELYGW